VFPPIAKRLNTDKQIRKYLKLLLTTKRLDMPCGKKRKRHKIATHKRKKRLRKNRHKKK
jgi:hypothetical protein